MSFLGLDGDEKRELLIKTGEKNSLKRKAI